MNNDLNKSLAALDAAADELLKKSNADTADKDDDLKPDDVSQDDDTEGVQKCDKPDGDNIKKGDKPDKDNIKKSDDADDEDEDSEDDADDEDEDTSKSLEDIQQEIIDDFNQDGDIASGAATSEFQAAIVAATAKSLGELQYDLRQSNKNDNHIAGIMAKSLQAVIASNTQLRAENTKLTRRLNKLEKSLNTGFENLLEAIDSLSTQPAHMRKSIGSLNIHDKNFSQSLNGGIGGFESLSKSQVMSVLTNELYASNPAVRAEDIISYESGAPLREELKSLVISKCK